MTAGDTGPERKIPASSPGKLRDSWGPTKDLAKAARTLTELQQLRQSADLSGITVVEEEDAFVASVSGDLRTEASTAPRRLESVTPAACRNTEEQRERRAHGGD